MRRSNPVLAVLFCIPFVLWFLSRAYFGVQFDRNIGGHLKRAADANSIELSVEEVDVALKAIEQEGLTKGYTSLVYTTPDEDVGFWYKNIKTCSTQLHSLPPTASQGEKDMVLLKLRQTLLDHTQQGERVTAPHGISVYPNNWTWMIAGAILFFAALIGVIKFEDSSSASPGLVEYGLILGLIAVVALAALNCVS